MEQFSLERYNKNPDRKVVTRDGRSARIICTNKLSATCPVVALVQEKDGNERTCSYSEDGRYDDIQSLNDLFFFPEKKSGWVNLYEPLSEGPCLGRIYSSKEVAKVMAKKCGLHPYINTIKIEWEE